MKTTLKPITPIHPYLTHHPPIPLPTHPIILLCSNNNILKNLVLVSSYKTCFNINRNFIKIIENINIITSIGTLELLVKETLMFFSFNVSAAFPRSTFT